VEKPRFSHDGHNRHLAVEQRLQLGILGRGDPGPPRRAKRSQARMPELQLLRLGEKGYVARV
jgi:hypothetical protein